MVATSETVQHGCIGDDVYVYVCVVCSFLIPAFMIPCIIPTSFL